MFVLDTRQDANGGLFQRLRLGSLDPEHVDRTLSRMVPMSPQQELAFDMLESLENPEIGYRVFSLWDYLLELPRMTGRSRALDDACAALVHAQRSVLKRRPAAEWIDPERYSKALRSLQAALESKDESCSDSTLAATSVMYLVEAMYGNGRNRGVLIHAGGVSKMLQYRGASKHTSGWSRLLAVEQTGGLFLEALNSRTPCILANSEWQGLFDGECASELDTLEYQMMKSMVHVPGLLHKAHAVREGDPSVSYFDLLADCISVNEHYHQVNAKIEAHLQDGSWVREAPATKTDNLTPTSFMFNDFKTARLYVTAWANILRMNSFIAALTGHCNSDLTIHADAAIMTENLDLCQRIWKSFEYAYNIRPLGAWYINQGLISSFEFADQEMRDKIMDWIYELEQYRYGEHHPVTQEQILHYCYGFSGRTFVTFEMPADHDEEGELLEPFFDRVEGPVSSEMIEGVYRGEQPEPVHGRPV